MIKVMVVDDNSVELQFMKAAFDSSEIDCKVVQDSTTALEAAIEYQPDFIILDLQMPQLNGLQLCTLLKTNQKTSDIKVMFLTSGGTTEDVMQSIHLGVIDYISKPISKHDLVDTIIQHDAVNTLRKIFSPLYAKANELYEKYDKPFVHL
jgi:DNA-binding response OmpR family regulator